MVVNVKTKQKIQKTNQPQISAGAKEMNVQTSFLHHEGSVAVEIINPSYP